MNPIDTTPQTSEVDYLRRPRRRKRGFRPRWLLFALVIFLAIVIAAIYYVFYRVYDTGSRQVEVNGENVQQMKSFLVHSHTWISRTEAAAFLQRIDASGTSLPKETKSYRGQPYIRASEFVARLDHNGDTSKLTKTQLIVTLKSTQHYQYQSKGDQVRQQGVIVDGQLVQRFLTVYHHGAPYIPVAATANILTHAGLHSSWNGKQLDVALTKQAAPMPIEQTANDQAIAFGSGKAIYAPSYTWHGQAYLPLYSLNTVLNQLGWSTSQSQWKWSLSSVPNSVPGLNNAKPNSSKATGSAAITPLSLTSSVKPQVLAFVPFYAGNMAAFHDALNYQSSYNSIAEDTWTISSSGALSGAAPSGTASQASNSGYGVYAMVTNLGKKGFDAKEVTSVLTNPVNAMKLHNALMNLVQSEDYTGIMLDFEAIPVSDRADYSKFVLSLAQGLRAEGKQLEVAVPALTGGSSAQNSAYNLAKLGQAADGIVVMAYDYSYFGGPAGPIAPLPWVQQVLAYTVSQVPAAKVVLGLDAYGYDWAGKHTTAVSLTAVDSFLKQHHIHPKWDKSAQAPWFKWTDSKGNVHTVYYENGKSTKAKLKLAKMYGAGGVAVWRAGLASNAVLKALAQYGNHG